MDSSDTTSSGYVGSKMYKTILLALLASLSGDENTPFYNKIIEHREKFQTSSTDSVS